VPPSRVKRGPWSGRESDQASKGWGKKGKKRLTGPGVRRKFLLFMKLARGWGTCPAMREKGDVLAEEKFTKE